MKTAWRKENQNYTRREFRPEWKRLVMGERRWRWAPNLDRLLKKNF